MTGIIVVGSSDFILGFMLAGIKETYRAEEKKELENRVNTVISEKKASILVLQDTDYYGLTPSIRKKLNESIEPVVITIGKLDEENIREKIKKAIGIDLYKKEKS